MDIEKKKITFEKRFKIFAILKKTLSKIKTLVKLQEHL